MDPRAGDGARTHDPQLGKLMLYQLSYAREASSVAIPRAPPFPDRVGFNRFPRFRPGFWFSVTSEDPVRLRGASRVLGQSARRATRVFVGLPAGLQWIR